ncbi:hypothetical protein O0L34_g13057 [Tuta absoluta]|nr:hypothetical protein O0L34_g13057 [Tuta absoluta]
MPVERSPPKATPKKTDEDQTETTAATEFVTGRRERPLQKDSFDFQLMSAQFEEMFNEWAAKHENNYLSLQNMIKEVKEQNAGIKTSIEFVTAKFDDLELQIKTLEQKRKEDQSRFALLEQKIENLQQAARFSSFEVRNVPMKKEENKEDLCNMAVKLGKVLNVPVQASDIKNIHRGYAKPNTVQPIIVEVQSVILKEKVITSAKTYNRANRNNQLTTKHLHLEGPATPVYVSEHLSPLMKRLFSLARDYRTTKGYKFFWATPGAIYLKKKEGEPSIRLKTEQDLTNLKLKDGPA